MGRKPRPQDAGLFAITNRGALQRDIFLDDWDRKKFLEILADVILRFGWVLHAFVEMTNHFHLLAEVPVRTLSGGIHLLQGWYGNYFNKRWDQTGHVFEKRAHTVAVNREQHLAENVRYMVLNPVRAEMVALPEQWRWSSYRATAGLVEVPEFLEVRATRSLFADDEENALKRFREFVHEGIGQPPPWDETRERYFEKKRLSLMSLPRSLQSPRMRARVERLPVELVLEAVCRAHGLTREAVTNGESDAAVLAFVYLARIFSRATLADLATALGVSTATAGRRWSEARECVEADSLFAAVIERASRILTNTQLAHAQ